ncbi:MraY family glycosyltransferase [Sessilibacter corallicola]|uniref:MraY family glycosyltransferase n=1 Tax=Sessilibacter corallicola TaxID=2904075 RepID=UPI001E355C6D|nr:glycosyltransferase family 4 protein [Sessilibacter corallicola]
MTTLFVFSAIAFCLTLWLTNVYRKFAIHQGLLDNPNHRSSHTIPTPTGGGIVTVCALIGVWLTAYLTNLLTLKEVLALVIPGTIIAAIGFFDDKHNLPKRWRFLGQVLAVCIALSLLYPLPELVLWQGVSINFNGIGLPFAAIAFLWLTNLYNFMDGIDGIAGGEAVTVLAGASLICFLNGNTGLATLLLATSLPVYGFLYWNWPPAKIFMGDACSTFLGLSFATLAVISSKTDAINLWSWFILLALFIVDATWTLAVRVVTGQNWREAHRTHLYQKLAQAFSNHLNTSLGIILLNLLWLTPISIYASKLKIPIYSHIFLILLSITPILLANIIFNAGKAATQLPSSNDS